VAFSQFSPPFSTFLQPGVTQISRETLAHCCQFGKNYSALDFHAHTHTRTLRRMECGYAKESDESLTALPLFSWPLPTDRDLWTG